MITGVNAGAWQQQVWGAGGPPLQGTVLRGTGRVEVRCRGQSCEADTERMTLRPVPSGAACLRVRKASRLVTPCSFRRSRIRRRPERGVARPRPSEGVGAPHFLLENWRGAGGPEEAGDQHMGGPRCQPHTSKSFRPPGGTKVDRTGSERGPRSHS